MFVVKPEELGVLEEGKRSAGLWESPQGFTMEGEEEGLLRVKQGSLRWAWGWGAQAETGGSP